MLIQNAERQMMGETSELESVGTTNQVRAASLLCLNTNVPDYIALMSPYRFGEVETFGQHQNKYIKTHGASSAALSRAWIKRLGNEYSDLSSSLPINTNSSVFLRFKEDAIVRGVKPIAVGSMLARAPLHSMN